MSELQVDGGRLGESPNRPALTDEDKAALGLVPSIDKCSPGCRVRIRMGVNRWLQTL